MRIALFLDLAVAVAFLVLDAFLPLIHALAKRIEMPDNCIDLFACHGRLLGVGAALCVGRPYRFVNFFCPFCFIRHFATFLVGLFLGHFHLRGG